MNTINIIQEIFAALNIALPITIAYHYFPEFTLSPLGITMFSALAGAYFMFFAYTTGKKQFNGLLHAPSGEYLELLHKEIIKCGICPTKIRLKYGYTDDKLALTSINTIVIDQMLWKNVDNDPEALKAKSIIKTHVLPTLSPDVIAWHDKINKLFTPETQNFIFRHELGHVVHNFSIKYYLISGFTIMFATAVGLLVARTAINSFDGIVALTLGMLAGILVDSFAPYALNIFFKAPAERNADLFAARFSSQEEIEAAAHFFEQYDICADEFKSKIGIPIQRSTIIFNGYPSGKTRAEYLRKIIAKYNK